MARATPANTGYTIISGAGTGTNGNRIDVWLEYKVIATDPEKLTSTLDIYFYAALASGYTSTTSYTSGLHSSLKLDGTEAARVTNGAYDFRTVGKENLLGHSSTTFSHNSDGTRSVYASGSFTTNSAYITGGNVAATITLPTVLPSAPSTVKATNGDIGGTSTVMVVRDDSNTSYTHSIKYSLGDVSGYITASGYSSSDEVRVAARLIPWSIPDSFYGQIPNSRSGTVTLEIRTYNGSKQVGSTQTATVTVTANEAICKPTVSGTVVDVNDNTRKFTESNTQFIRFMSTAKATITGAARNGATIKALRINQTEVQASGGSITKEAYTGTPFTFHVEDSRGYASTCTVEPDDADVIPYVRLTNEARWTRDDPTSGATTLTIEGDYWEGAFQTVDNVLDNVLSVSYGLYGDEINVTDQVAIENNRYKVEIPLEGYDYTKSFQCSVWVKDALNSEAADVLLKQGLPVFDWGQDDFNFHVPVTIQGVDTSTWYRGYCGDANSVYQTGTYRLSDSAVNVPSNNGILLVFGLNSQEVLQIAMDYSGASRWSRVLWWGRIYDWKSF